VNILAELCFIVDSEKKNSDGLMAGVAITVHFIAQRRH
jgi:hypothetical protein